MNPYIIERQPQPNLIDAFMRGREQVENMRANRQTRELNDLRLQSERDRIDQEKIARAQSEKLKQAFGTIIKQSGGDWGRAEQMAQTQYPEQADMLMKGFAQIRENQYNPMAQRKEQLGVQSEQNELVSKYGAPKAKAFLSMEPQDQMDYFTDFVSDLKQTGIPVPPQWEDGFTPESLNQVKMLASMESSQQGSLPANLQVFNAYKNMTPEEKQTYQEATRAQQWLDQGSYRYNSLTGEKLTKDIPIQETPGFKANVAGASESAKIDAQVAGIPKIMEAKGEISPKQIKEESQDKFESILGGLEENYKNLAKLGGIVDLNQGKLSNLGARAKSTKLGQTVQGAVGSEEQVLREQINMAKPALINMLRQASGMSAKNMDSEKELKFFLQTATDETKSLQANLSAIKSLRDLYGKEMKKIESGYYKPDNMTAEQHKRFLELKKKQFEGTLK
jgi:hypothetical protein